MIRTSSLLQSVQRRWSSAAWTALKPPSVPFFQSRPIVVISAIHPSSILDDSFNRQSSRSYISRAHPRPPREFAVPDAIALILKDIEQRKKKRVKRMEYYLKRKPLIVKKYQKTKTTTATATSTTSDKISASSSSDTATNDTAAATAKKKKKDSGTPSSSTSPPAPFDPEQVKHPIETFELAICLNLDPRKPGQSLRGSITLPHGTGKKGRNVVVLTNDEQLAEAAKAAGALHSGGDTVIDQLVAGTIAIDSIAAILAMSDIMPTVTKKAARLLGPRGLMPNAKVGTIHTQGPSLLAALESAVAGKEVTYRTEKEGIVHVPVGNHTFSVDKLLDNIGTVMKAIVDAKPDSYGKGKKKQAKKGQALSAKSQPKYLLRVSMSSTQSKGVRVDLRTLDPNSAFFLSTLDPLAARREDSVTTISDGTGGAGRTFSASQ